MKQKLKLKAEEMAKKYQYKLTFAFKKIKKLQAVSVKYLLIFEKQLIKNTH